MTFEFNAQQYIEASDHQLLWGQQLVSELKLTGHESILDLGCGDGRLTALLALQVPRGYVIGIDASQQMTAAARQHHHHLTNLSFRTLDINHLCCENEFDVIFSNAALHWVHDHPRMVRNVYRALKSEGVIRFNFAGHGNCPNLIRILHQTMAEPEFAPHVKDFCWPWTMPTEEDTRAWVKEVGFQSIQVWNENKDTVFSNEKSLIAWMDQPSLVPFKAALDQPYYEGFRQRIIEQMLKQTRQPDGGYLEQFKRINVRAVKETSSHEFTG